MAAPTFESIYKQVILHCPLASPLLCRTWVQNAYNRLCDLRDWSWLRAENEFLINVQKTGLVTVTYNSTQVTIPGGGLSIALADAGRQFKGSVQGPPYTIVSVDPSLTFFTLDMPYGSPTAASVSGTVLDAYISCPEDFGRFIAVIDPQNFFKMHLWVTEAELNRWDPARTSSGTSWAIVDRRMGTVGGGVTTQFGNLMNQAVQYEVWPYATTQRRYPFFYVRRPEILTEASTFAGPLRYRGDIMLCAALKEACEWPGGVNAKNPYFNLPLAERKQKEVEGLLEELMMQDEDVYMIWLQTVGLNEMRFAPIDAKYFQSHDGYLTPYGTYGARW